MRTNLTRGLTNAVCVIGIVTMAHAQQSGSAVQRVDLGKFEYEAHCVACHGLAGKGDGPFVPLLKSGTAANLTELSKRNNGVFPFVRVYETIDGTDLVTAHGTRAMPIWGNEYKTIASGGGYYDTGIRGMDSIPYNDPEAFTRAKILALTEYVYRLQAK